MGKKRPKTQTSPGKSKEEKRADRRARREAKRRRENEREAAAESDEAAPRVYRGSNALTQERNEAGGDFVCGPSKLKGAERKAKEEELAQEYRWDAEREKRLAAEERREERPLPPDEILRAGAPPARARRHHALRRVSLSFCIARVAARGESH